MGNDNRESNLARVSTLQDTDLVRVVASDQSRNMLVGAFVQQIALEVQTFPTQLTFATIIPSQGLTDADINFIDCTTANWAEVLPSAASFVIAPGQSRVMTVKRIDGTNNTATLTAGAGDTIEGEPDLILAGIDRPYVRLASDGVNTFYIVD